MKQTYKDYLEESTNTVKSRDRLSKLTLALTTLGIWALSVISFWLVESGTDSSGFSTAIMWGVLPVVFFAASFIIGERNYLGKFKWFVPICFGIMHALSGYAAIITTGENTYKQIIWPDFTKLPIGFFISLAGIFIGMLVYNRSKAVDN